MNNVKIQLLASDEHLWEVDWLKFLISDIQDHIDIEYDCRKIDTDNNTILICNHAVPYRYVLENLRMKGKKYAVVLLSDENLFEPCEWLHDPACVGLLRNYIHPNQLTHPKVQVFGLGYKRGFLEYLKNEGSENRKYTWCFAGTPHGDRAQMLKLFNQIDNYKVHTCSGFGAADGLNTKDYVNMLQNSTFALCPAGQDSMDSFRMYEALEAGCIPVTVRSSKQFMIRPSYWHGVFYGLNELPFICEDTFEECLDKIKTLEPTKIINLKTECKSIWDNYKQKWKSNFNYVYSLLKKKL